MNRQEAIHVLETIKNVYPKYDITKEKAKMLIPKLLSMHYPCVLERLAQHVAKHPYPPTISEIAVYETKRNTQLETLKKWREEAAHVPVELKETFHKQMLHVIREKTCDEKC